MHQGAFWAWAGFLYISPHIEPGDHFGEVLAAGDFNGDGYDDLAVGARSRMSGRSRTPGK
jgi:hypothetical protein